MVEYHSLRDVPNSGFWNSRSEVVLGSQEYVDAYRAASRGRLKPKPVETFAAVLEEYLASNSYRSLAERTRKDYRTWIDRIRDRFGEAPIAAFERSDIRGVAMKWRDQWSGRQAAYAWTVLKVVVSWAYDANRVREHHLKGGGRKLYRANRAEVIFTNPDIEAVEAIAPDWVSRILRLACETGLRPGDLVKLTRADIHATPAGRQIRVLTGKSNRRTYAVLPVTRGAARVIDATPPDQVHILVGANGRVMAPLWASRAVKHWAIKAGLDKRLRLYDARGTAVTRLYRAGATLGQLALAFGWSPRTAAERLRDYATLDPAMSDQILELLEEEDVQSNVQSENSG